MPGFVYLNAYAVTRHYGGPEEGGWWYNAGEPLASVPIPATFTPKCGQYHCPPGCEGASCGEPECIEPCEQCSTPPVPDQAALEKETARLKELLANAAHGNIYSSRGGVALEIRHEEHMAESWPKQRPHYE